MKRIGDYFRNPYKIFESLAMRGFFKNMNDKEYLSWLYRARMGRFPDLNHPKSFNEKLQWLKLNDRKPEYTEMVDKYLAKKYVEKRIGEKYIIPTLGVWDEFDQIEFEKLPDQFVLKTTHDSGGVVICKDKAKHYRFGLIHSLLEFFSALSVRRSVPLYGQNLMQNRKNRISLKPRWSRWMEYTNTE